MNSTLLEGSIHLNFILVMLVEIPGNMIIILLLDRIGRRTSLAGCFLICGGAVIGSGYTQGNYTHDVLFLRFGGILYENVLDLKRAMLTETSGRFAVWTANRVKNISGTCHCRRDPKERPIK